MGMTLEKLAIIMKEGFDAVDQRFDANDERFDTMDARLDSLTTEVRAMRRDFGEELRQLRADVENIKGFSKEIDFALERIAVLERKFGELEARVTT